MTDQDLLNILENAGSVSVPYFDGAELSVDLDILSPAEVLPALKNFLGLSAENRRSDARHLVAYCKMMMEVLGEEVVVEDLDGHRPTLENIWDYARAKILFFSKLEQSKYAKETTVFVQIEGEVAWEPEHGLQMSWAEGNRLVKAGAVDGHPTNGHASAKPEHDQYVFYCYDPALCTFPDAL